MARFRIELHLRSGMGVSECGRELARAAKDSVGTKDVGGNVA